MGRPNILNDKRIYVLQQEVTELKEVVSILCELQLSPQGSTVEKINHLLVFLNGS